ncbi:MAG: clostripain-related cysteine peptidase, partial [Bacillota bacterium]|nr:clostripain-related cysteine peptidase [Bacillota bacterium]
MERKSGGGSRKKRVTGDASGGGVFRRGSAVNPKAGKPVGKTDGYADRKQGSSKPIGSQGGSGSFGPTYTNRPGKALQRSSSGSKGKFLILIIILVVGYFLLRSCSGQIADPNESDLPVMNQAEETGIPAVTGDPVNNAITPSTGITGPRTPRTMIIGNGQDIFTIMIYMCGTDLESSYGMATADLNEMLHATISDKLNIIVETGGTSRWRNSVIKNTSNQRYQVTSSGLRLLVDNLGRKAMTDPATLQNFITYSATNFPANRYALIFWDHGGGSLSGFGYDQLFPNSGSMTISQINSALEGAGVKFDFVGFDACLMATLETAYMLNYHADYMIASEETEPGIGWYYTNWITALSDNTSMDTVSIGKMIIDDYINKCGQEVPRETTTLSLIDLVTLNNVVDEAFRDFALSAEAQLDDDYKIISNARGNSREFNRSRLDQVDLIDLAEKINSPESRALIDALRQSIKYNRTSSNISRAHGVSIYFPYDELRNLSSMLSVYERIGMGEEYNSLIRKFANMVAGGQITTGGSSNPLSALFGSSGGGGGSGSSSDLWALAWNAFFANADFSSITGALTGDQTNWVDPNLIQSNADFYQKNYLDASSIKLTQKGNTRVLKLT